ncbi:MAG: cytochrome c [Gammaproteobacteria bacterium]|nr:MAG: cytochrome c [Gammaproteobacteria bacterium]
MKKGEKWLLIGIAIFVVGMSAIRVMQYSGDKPSGDGKIPFYSDASPALRKSGHDLFKRYRCRDCHTLWTVRNVMQAVPAPAMDGIGSIRDEAWLYHYLSAEDPQSILPTRLKKEFQMPSYAHLPEKERRTLARYLASLKVQDWYLEQTRKAEFEKLTGKPYKVSRNAQ